MAKSARGWVKRARRIPSISVALIGGIAIWVFLTIVSSHAVGGNSDGATVVLEGQSLAHGNVILHGWILSQDSFWTVDALFYGVAVLILGVHGYLLNLIPALIASLIVIVSAHIATSRNPGASRLVAYGIVLLGLMFPVAAWAQFYLAGPYHLGTTLYCLCAFGLVTGEMTTKRAIGAFIFLVAGILGDLQTISLGVIPIALAGCVAIIRTWSVKTGGARLAIAGTSTLAAFGVRKLFELAGAFTFAPARVPATFSQSLSNVLPGLRLSSHLVGVGTGPYGPSPIPSVFSLAHVVELALIVGVFVAVCIQLLRGLVMQPSAEDHRTWELDDLLLIAILGSLSTYAYLAVTGSDAEGRYLSAGIIFAVVLTARVLARTKMANLPLRRSVEVLSTVVAIAIVIGGVYTATSSPPPQPETALISLLRSHHLHDGLGGYWSASITTVKSNDAIKVRPVISGPDGRIERYARQSLDSWYANTGANFLVYYANVNVDAITRASARATFGPARHVYSVGPYRVLVYAHPIHVAIKGYAA